MPPSNSSIMRQRITIQERALHRDTHGQAIPSWEEYLLLYAAVEPLRGDETMRSASGALPQVVASADTRVRIRYRKGLDTSRHRVVFDGIVYDLLAVIHDRDRGQSHLMLRASAPLQEGGPVNG